MPATWVLVATVVLLFVHLALVALAIRRSRAFPVQQFEVGTSTDAGESVDPGGGQGDGTVRCQQCGAANEAEYRYCRECVSELPTSARP
jgi:hypothetical protein